MCDLPGRPSGMAEMPLEHFAAGFCPIGGMSLAGRSREFHQEDESMKTQRCISQFLFGLVLFTFCGGGRTAAGQSQAAAFGAPAQQPAPAQEQPAEPATLRRKR